MVWTKKRPEVRTTETPWKPWWETTEFDYIRIPKDLFRNPYYTSLTMESKLLYGFLLDRASLSRDKGGKWLTEDGHPFVIFTLAEIQDRLHCGQKKAGQLLKSLRISGLIEVDRPKRDGPYHIRVLPFEVAKGQLGSGENDTCRPVENTVRDLSKMRLNKTEINNTERNKTHTIRDDCEREIKKEIDYDILCMDHPKEQVDPIVEVLVDTLSTPGDTVWILGQPRPKEEAKKRLLENAYLRIPYIFAHMRQQKSPIGSYRAYYLARLWEPEADVDAFYEAWARRDGVIQ